MTKRNGFKHYILTNYSKERDHITVQTHCASPLLDNTYCDLRCMVTKLSSTVTQQCKNKKKGFTIERPVVCTVHVEVIAAPKNSVLCTQVYFSSGKEKNSPYTLLFFHSTTSGSFQHHFGLPRVDSQPTHRSTHIPPLSQELLQLSAAADQTTARFSVTNAQRKILIHIHLEVERRLQASGPLLRSNKVWKITASEHTRRAEL